ncbi:MAG TPA: TonB-dependent receptor plug domain-containing protein [Candidatus Acidoferrum sp.]|nr:TonB-dependent receptor plug domain-containing protein [Candidatus Acidoferrum sp.]
MSLNVVDGNTIDALHMRTLPDLVSQTQNVSMFEDFPGAGLPTWVIRGVGLQDFNSNNTPTAAVYNDGVYQASTAMGDEALFDIDQAEILKGPQGGLYGRNTTGGAVLLNSHRGKVGVQEQSFSISYGRWQQVQADGMVNVPLTADAAWRLAGRVDEAPSSAGWQTSMPSGEHHGGRDRYDIRSWLHWGSGDLQLDWKVQGGRDDSDIALGRSIGLYDPTGAKLFCDAVLAGYRDDAHCINFGGVNLLSQGKPALIENLSLQASDGSRVFSSPINAQNNNYTSTLLDLTWKNERYQIKSLTSYDDSHYGVTLDLDGSEGEYGHRTSSSDINVASEELQLMSVGNAYFSWLTGVVVTHENFLEGRIFSLRDNTAVGLGQGILRYRQVTNSQAAYADFSFQLASDLKVDTTLRYTNERKLYRDGEFYMPGTPPYYFVQNLSADYNLDQHLSGSIDLEYQYAQNELWYARISSGFKSGGFYGGFPFDASYEEPYKAETLVAYEAGVKRDFPQQHLHVNASVFHYDYKNVQGFFHDYNPITGTSIDRLTNVADARHDGVELEAKWQFAPLWYLDAMIGWLEADYVNGTKVFQNIAGESVLASGQRPYAPRRSGNIQLRHQSSLFGDLQAEWRLSYSAQSNFSGAQSSPVDAAINHLPGYGKFDASLTIAAPNSPWTTSLWVKNLTDKVYRTRVKDDGLGSYIEFFGEPRSFGLTVNYRL